jgi:Arc/MetJ-type ribon-helix-helix transcriptional regulator
MGKYVTVTEETAEIIQRKVDQGLYADVETAFAEAARLLDEYDYVQELREMLREAEEEIDRGEAIPWTRELNEQIFERAKEMHRRGIKPNSDALP